MIELLPKQVQLVYSDADIILYGGARGGAKTFGTSFALIGEPLEIYTESDIRMKRLNPETFRVKLDPETNSYIYYRLLIDYPHYMAVIVRRTVPALRANTLVENKKMYPLFGGKFDKEDYAWVFPSGARIYLRPLNDARGLEFFQGPSFQRFVIEELTQFDEDMVKMAIASCRSTPPIGGGVRIPAKVIYTSNPGGRGHKWVKETIVDKCPPLPDGDPIYLEEYDISYQPLKANKPYVNEHGERILFIPSLLFDNPHLYEEDKRYARNLLSMPEGLRNMWLFARWDCFAGQFFYMWEDGLHIIDEYEFYKVEKNFELSEAKRRFNWKAKGYRLYMSNDYGFAEKSAWACGFYAVDDKMRIIKFAEIVESGMSITQQAKYTKEFLKSYYNLTIEDFDLCIADPKSYWERRDRGEEFYTLADEYLKEGIYLTKGRNERQMGAAAMIEALMPAENGMPNMRYLSCCEQTISCIANLPSDPRNPNDVDTTSFDHPYDENRYFLMVVIGEPLEKKVDSASIGWRNNLKENTPTSEPNAENETRAYLTA